MRSPIFLTAFEKLFPQGDFFTLNVSSPNTPSLRELQDKTLLADLLSAVQEKNRQLAAAAQHREKPVFVKIAPDMDFAKVDEIIEVVDAAKLAGIVATNATAFMRDTLKSPLGREPGGLSGRPITSTVTNFVSHIYKNTRGRLPIIGVGGIFNAEDAYDKIRAGASAVQIYTGFIYEGPATVKRINRGLIRLLERDGFKSVAEAVGQRKVAFAIMPIPSIFRNPLARRYPKTASLDATRRDQSRFYIFLVIAGRRGRLST